MAENSSSSIKASPAWTVPQRQAIDHIRGDLLLSAAAGSGKTAVLAERCAALVCAGGGQGTGVDNLLVVTFTEAAASEMRGRIAQAIDHALRQDSAASGWLRRQAATVERAAISTLHAFCARVLRQHFHEADVDPSFEVMDEDDARLMREEVLGGLLAQWHRLPARDPGAAIDGERFTDYFESYAQGRESSCCRQILSVHRMLATTADPVAYVRDARAAYGSDAEATLAAFSRETLMGQLRLARLAAERACREVESIQHTESMRGKLREAAGVIENAMTLLDRRGVDAWPDIARSFGLDWGRLAGIKQVEDFSGLKNRTWEKMKGIVGGLMKAFSRDPAGMLADLRRLARPLDTLLALTEAFQKTFAAAKRAENRLDFNDLERFTLEMFRRPEQSVTRELRRRYHHVLVDEFQDINPLQAAILDAVRDPAAFGGAGNLFRVGDVKQSIYGFRLAEPELFLAQEREARGTALPGEALTGQKPGATSRFLALPHNFRSQPWLIAAMNGIFERLLTPEVAGVAYDDTHALQPAPGAAAAASARGDVPIEVHLLAMKSDGGEEDESESPHQEGSRDEDDDAPTGANQPEALTPFEFEARMVADRVAALLAEGRTFRAKDGTVRKIEPRDIAVLLRAVKGRAMIFARAFSRRGILLHADLSTGYFDAPEIANTLALLNVLDNPQQDIPLATVLLGPYGNFTHDELATLRLTYDRKQVSFSAAAARYATDAGDPDAAGQAGEQGLFGPHAPGFSAELAARLRAFFVTLDTWRSWLHTRPLHEGLAEIYAQSKILVYVSGLDAGAQRVANLRQLHQRALTFGTFRKQGLHRFLRFLDRLQEQESLGGGSGDAGEAAILSDASNVVRLMSIHKSKGLEFPIVIVAGLGAKFHLRTEVPLVHRALGIGLDVIDLAANVRYDSAATLRIADAQNRAQRAEELRLLYVAMTRARDGLILTGNISRDSKVDEWRATWRGHAGPLPEDVLLRGTTPLDWIMPALASSGAGGTAARLTVAWPGETPSQAHVVVAVHAPQGDVDDSVKHTPDDSKRIQQILAGQPLDGVPQSPVVDELLARVAAQYPHAVEAARPAVQTVTYLKTLATETVGEEDVADLVPDLQAIDLAAEEYEATLGKAMNATADAAERTGRIEAARRRGIATHRVLQLLDLNDVSSAAIDRQMAEAIARRTLSPEERDRADWPGIEWFLFDSEAGKRMLAAAKKYPDTFIRREIPFVCLAPPDAASTPEPADLPTLRGVIDVLIANVEAREAEIIDYKTDSAFFLWESRLEDYRRQMVYYMRAAGDILGYPVRQATLVFLAARREVEIRL